MHELSIAMSLIDAAEEEAARYRDETLAAVHVTIGADSGIVPDALSAAYALARENTALAACELLVEIIPGRELLVSALEFTS